MYFKVQIRSFSTGTMGLKSLTNAKALYSHNSQSVYMFGLVKVCSMLVYVLYNFHIVLILLHIAFVCVCDRILSVHVVGMDIYKTSKGKSFGK